uniref:hypothetical protein n=1 Tax=uncultured Adlercreutzia sp. TaxID=875803 RepID=UPI00258EBC0C
MSKYEPDKFIELDKSLNTRWKIYIDTCSLYQSVGSDSDFWDRFVPVLQSNDCKFIITTGTFGEIKKHKHSDKNKELAATAALLEKTLYPFRKADINLMVTIGDTGEFHDNAIQATIRARSLTCNQVYITNDLGNAWDVYNNIFNSRSVDRKVKKLLIYKIDRKGILRSYRQLKFLSGLNVKELDEYFSLWHSRKFKEADAYLESKTDYISDFSVREKRHAAKPKSVSLDIPSREANQKLIAKHESVVYLEPAIKSVVNPDYEVPRSGSSLHAVKGDKVVSLKLGKKLAHGRGGEGVVYTIDSGHHDTDEKYVAKIYKKSKLCKSMDYAYETMLKINYIVGTGFSQLPLAKSEPEYEGLLGDYVKFPLYVLVNDNDEFVGYLMERAEGIQLSKLIADGAVEEEFS